MRSAAGMLGLFAPRASERTQIRPMSWPRRSVCVRAAELAGFVRTSPSAPKPLAAATISEHTKPGARTFLVADFGGGTSDCFGWATDSTPPRRPSLESPGHRRRGTKLGDAFGTGS